MALDQSLDSIISSKKSNNRAPRGVGAKRGGRGGGGGAGNINQALQNQRVARNAAATATPVAPAQGGARKAALPLGDKIVISNLPMDVTELQIKVSFIVQLIPTTRGS